MLSDYSQILNYNFYGNLISAYLVAGTIFLATLLALKIFKQVAIARIKIIVDHTDTDVDDLFIDILDSLGWPLYVIIAIFISIQFLILPSIVGKAVYFILLILTAYYVAKSCQKLIDYGFSKISRHKKKNNEEYDSSALNLLSRIAKLILWLGVGMIVLQNLGYNITTLIAGLGVGGIAVAFALQNVLGDVFASFSIYFDRPFQVGDFIIIGSDMGTVKKIGIKSTRIQTLEGQELIVSNKELTETRINNYKRMEKRRVVFAFGVTYSTPTEKLKKINQIVKGIIDRAELADLDRVHFKEFADSSLNFEIVYFLNSSDYNRYMDTQQAINLSLKEEFEKEGIEFAFPTQTVFLEK